MRDLLSRLPDPGPMPDDLVARISAALAAEADAVRPAPSAGGAAAGPDERVEGAGQVLPLRPRRSRFRHLGVAAAVVVAIGLGGYGLTAMPGDVGATLGAGGSGDDSATEVQSGSSAAQSDSSRALEPATDPGVVVVMSGRDYQSEDLAADARALADGRKQQVPDLTAEAPSIGPIATPIGARSCAASLGVPPTAALVVDVATVDGRPAAVLVATADGARTAYAVERYCPTGTTGLISGPVPLD
jgi:hypothetical protein